MKKLKNIKRREILEHWWIIPVGATLGTFGFMGYRANKILDKNTTVKQQHLGQKVEIASKNELVNIWDSKEFEYDKIPCILIKIPKNSQESDKELEHDFVAFSSLCTHQKCPVILIKDVEILSLAYNYRAKENQIPQLGCPCHYSVFDPTQQGKSVFGQARNPLDNVLIKIENNKIIAYGWQKSS